MNQYVKKFLFIFLCVSCFSCTNEVMDPASEFNKKIILDEVSFVKADLSKLTDQRKAALLDAKDVLINFAKKIAKGDPGALHMLSNRLQGEYKTIPEFYNKYLGVESILSVQPFDFEFKSDHEIYINVSLGTFNEGTTCEEQTRFLLDKSSGHWEIVEL